MSLANFYVQKEFIRWINSFPSRYGLLTLNITVNVKTNYSHSDIDAYGFERAV